VASPAKVRDRPCPAGDRGHPAPAICQFWNSLWERSGPKCSIHRGAADLELLRDAGLGHTLSHTFRTAFSSSLRASVLPRCFPWAWAPSIPSRCLSLIRLRSISATAASTVYTRRPTSVVMSMARSRQLGGLRMEVVRNLQCVPGIPRQPIQAPGANTSPRTPSRRRAPAAFGYLRKLMLVEG